MFINVPSLPVTVREDSAPGSTVLTCSVSDADSVAAPSGQHVFYITDGNSDNKFSLDNATCALTLADDLNFENVSRYDVTIEASDLDPVSPRRASMVFSVEVEDVNEKPTFKNVPRDPVLISEDTAVDTVVFTCSARDPDHKSLPRGQVVYDIVDGNSNNNTFTLTPGLCELNLTSSLDYEIESSYTLKLTVSDLDPDDPLTSTMTLSITVTDVNEFTPMFINVPSLPVTVREDSAPGSTVLTCSVSDDDGATAPSGQHAFYITAGNSDNRFSLDNSTGALTLADDLNFENVSRYDVTIEASDLDPVSPRSVSMVFSIEVEDVNEKPTFKNLPGDPVQVPEDTAVDTVVFTCSARDPDDKSLPRGQLVYDIVGGNEAGKFSVDNHTCEVTVSRSLDFEDVAHYMLILRAQDQENPANRTSVSEPLVLDLTDINEHTPSFVNVPSSPIEIGELSSVGSTVFTCTAHDLDSDIQPSGHLRYRITGGNEDGQFSILDDSVCEVTLTQTLNFETRQTYPLTLTVRDLDPHLTLNSSHTFDVSVIDENDPPELQSTVAMPTVAENSESKTFVFNCSATDQDDSSSPSGQLVYSIIGGNVNKAFRLKPPCKLETRKPLDHEERAFYDLEIQVTDLDPNDPQNDTRIYRVKVIDLNDNTPYFYKAPKNPIHLPEDTPMSVPFLQCAGDDDDSPLELTGQVRYEIVAGNEENFFTLDHTNCSMSLSQPLDYENTTLNFNLTVRIYDLDPVAPRSTEQDYRICVTNVNDNSPIWVEELPTLTHVPENSPLGMHLGRCSAADGDSPLYPSGHVRYSIDGGNSLSLFYLNPYTCDLYVNGLLDYEQKKSHVLKIIAFDLDPDNPRESEVMRIRIRILDDNDYGPTCQSRIIMTEVPEDTPSKSVVMTLNCSDFDQGRSSSALRFSALSSTDTLTVEWMTGNIKLARKLDWDNASEPREHELRVEVRDNSQPPTTASATVRVILTDADDIKPVFQQSSYVALVNENVPRGSTVLKISATDADEPKTPASTVQYGLHSGPDPDWFLVHPYTGEVIVKDALDAEAVLESRFKVFAFSSVNRDKRAKADIVFSIGDVNDSGPKFTKKMYDISVQEATSYTSPLLTVQAHDSDSGDDGQVRYSIEEGPLTINNITGDIHVKGQLDFEAQYFYVIPVMTFDLGTPSLTSTATVVLSVTPLNEFDPVWNSGTEFVVSEDTVPGTVIFQLNATDDDASWDGEVEYSSSLAPDLPFLVDQSGRVFLAAPLDREVKDTYTLKVIANDRSVNRAVRRSVTTDLRVIVSDVNDLAPECSPLPVAVVVFPWTGFPVASVECSPDEDAVNGELSYSITGGDVDGVFEINRTRGDISATRKPTHDMYDLHIEVSDGGTPPMTSQVDVVILVEPELTLTNLPASQRVREDTAVGTVTFTVAACCSFTTLQFELLSGNEDELFHLRTGNGDVTLVRHLDREMTSRHVLRVGVGDERGQTATATLVMEVEDVNDNAPVFNPVFSSLWMPELVPAGSMLGQWTATDRDLGTNGQLTYSLLDTESNGTFSVDNATGVVTMVKALDFETASSVDLDLLVVAVDGGDVPLSATATVHVEIVNSDEHRPQFLTSSGTVTVRENFPLGVVIFQLQARDLDKPDVIRYQLNNSGTPFSVLPESGKVILTSPLDREVKGEYDLHFQAVNDLGDTATLDVKVQVEDVDDNDPTFSSSVYEFHVQHDTAADVIVGHVTVTDDDIGDNANFSVSIVSGNGAGYFVLEGSAVKTAKPVTYDGIREFVLTLRAQKTGTDSDYRFAEAAVRIEVLPARTQPKFKTNSWNITLEENTPINTLILDLDATTLGATEGDHSTLHYVIRSGNSAGVFSIEESTGEIQVIGEVDYEQDTVFVLMVDAKSKDDPTVKDSITVNINVINVNDNSPEPDSSVYKFDVDEDSTSGTFVGRVIFTDRDTGLFGEVSLTMTGCPKFSTNSSTGDVIVKAKLSYNDDVRHACLITAFDGGQPARSGMTSVMIEVRDVNDHSPNFEGAPYRLGVYENTPPGSTITTIVATDPDEGEKGRVTYSLESGDPEGVFFLNQTSGELLLTKALKTTQFILRLRAADGGNPPLTSFTNVSLDVLDVNNHAPVFSATSRSVEIVVDRLASPGTQLFVVNASDGDVGENGFVAYVITAGNEEGLFFLDGRSGQLSTRAWLTQAGNEHELLVAATDHGAPAIATTTIITIAISPPLPPSHTTLSFLPLQNFTLAENASVGSVVGILSPYPASPAHVRDYVIVSGNYDDSFQVMTRIDGTAQLRVKKGLDFERYNLYYLWVNISIDASGGDGDVELLQKLVQINVTDINDNVPQFEDGSTLVLFVAEHTPAGHTLWTLPVLDQDQEVTNGPLEFQVDSASVPDVLSVNAQGQILLMSPPDYDAFQQVDAVISVRDSTVPHLSSSISVTLHIIDVDERQYVTVTSAATMYISTEIPHNTKEGQVVYQLSAADFNMKETATTTTTFLSLDTNGPFAINAQTGDVTVVSPERLADDSIYFLWVVCKVRDADDTITSEMAMLRIDTFDKYKNVVAVQLPLDAAELEGQRSALKSRLQAMFSNTQRVGIYSVIAFGTSARRRLLATDSLALMYVVEDTSADQLDNVMGSKSFLTQQQILQVLQESPDGTPASQLTGSSLAVAMVMPYQTGETTTPTPITRSTHFPYIVAVICLLFIVVVVFIIVCVVYRVKRKRTWNTQHCKDKSFNTPAPAFYIRRDSMFPDDVSMGSETSLLDDDSGMGDSLGSRSFRRKSLTPPSSESDACSDHSDGGDDEITLSPKRLLDGPMASGTWRHAGNFLSDVQPSRTASKKRYTWKKSKPSFTCPAPKPPVTWLPPLPHELRSGRRGSNVSVFEPPSFARYGRRASGCSTEGYFPSDRNSSRRGSQNWTDEDSAGFPSSRRGSRDFTPSRRRSSLLQDLESSPYALPQAGRRRSSLLNDLESSPYAIPQAGRRASIVNQALGSESTTSKTNASTSRAAAEASAFSFGTSANSSAFSSETKHRPTDSNLNPQNRATKGTTIIPGHQVTWKPKRNTVKKVFHQKLQWKAVSTIPKATPRPSELAADNGTNNA